VKIATISFSYFWRFAVHGRSPGVSWASVRSPLPLVRSPLPFFDLGVRLFLGHAVAFLNAADELVPFAGNLGQIVIGQLPPLLLYGSLLVSNCRRAGPSSQPSPMNSATEAKRPPAVPQDVRSINAER